MSTTVKFSFPGTGAPGSGQGLIRFYENGNPRAPKRYVGRWFRADARNFSVVLWSRARSSEDDDQDEAGDETLPGGTLRGFRERLQGRVRRDGKWWTAPGEVTA